MWANHLWRAVGFFGVWGGFYGFVCGLIAGSLIVPVAGWFYSVPFGTIIGLILGLLIGLVTGIVDLVRINDLHHPFYNRLKVAGTGLFTAVAAPTLVYLAGKDILWCQSLTGDGCYPRLEPLVIPVLIQAAFWGGLASAYVAQRFINRYTEFEETAVYDQLKFWINYLLSWWQLHLIIGICATALTWLNLPYFYQNLAPDRLLPRLMEILIITSIASMLLVMPFFSYVFSILMVFLNKVIFEEYLPGLTVAAYKNILTVFTVLFTLVIGLTLVYGLLLPLALPVAVAIGITARAYADWYWSANRPEKKKAQADDDEEADIEELAANPFEDTLTLDAPDNLRSLES